MLKQNDIARMHNLPRQSPTISYDAIHSVHVVVLPSTNIAAIDRSKALPPFYTPH